MTGDRGAVLLYRRTARQLTRARIALVVSIALLGSACSPTTSPSPSASGGTDGTRPPDATSTSGSTPPVESGPPPTAPPDGLAFQRPSRASLIQQALAEGRIDEVTALDYRVRAMFGLTGLPDEFAAGVPRGDSAALAQIAGIIDTLSDADQARLRPYLLRPTEEGSPFSDLTARVASLDDPAGPLPPLANAAATCATWLDSGDLDQRFKVWACADGDPQAAEIDVATIVTLIDRYWDKMSTDMGKPPPPDAHGPNVPAEYGGDARIDFYALHMGQVVYRDGPNEIPSDAAAATVAAPPFTNPDGTARNASSSYMLLNVDTLERDETTFELDLIHEFFHALQNAHNFRATQDGAVEHWFVESSATWAETYYLRSASDQPHGWFFDFQDERRGLSDADLDHQYASYVWPFFMEQEAGAQSIFDAWKATDPIPSRDFAAVTAVVGAQLPFATRFRDFAIRNVNINSVLQGAGLTRYDDLDPNFYDNWPPFAMIPSHVSPGSPYVSGSQSIPELAAFYFGPTFSNDARKITISIAQLQPSGQVDGDFLAHYADGTWKHIPIVGGVLQFCRDDDGWDIDSGFLAVSNHGVRGSVTGSVEIDGKRQCSGDVRLHGTFTGHHDDFLTTTDATFDVIVIWKRPNDVHDPLSFTFESGSFTFSTDVDGVCGGTRSEGANLHPPAPETPTSLWYGELQERSYEVHISLIDERLDQGGLKIAATASFDIPSGAVGCEPPYQSKGFVSVCAMEFRLQTLDTLQTNATCTQGDTTWTGHLVAQ